jgi:hypothetical protein
MAYAYINAESGEYKATVAAHHMIPKFVGLYLGANTQGWLRDPTVCVSGNDDNCITDDYNELMEAKLESIDESGFIAAAGNNPQVEVEVPDNQLGDITEYGFGLWFRF